MAGVSLEGVSKRYGRVVAVESLDLDIADGETMMLVGPSGCGKTTVLRLIAGLESPDTGTIRFDGRDVTEVAPRERDIAMVFEGYALFPHLAVRDNLSFALRLRHLPADEVDRRVADVARAMELDHLLRRRPPALATGEAQHVAVGRAVVRDAPAVLLLDDALSHLDAQQRLEARTEVARLHDELGSTIVSVTHDQAEALAVGTRVAVMDEGRLHQVGTPQDIYERPADVFVAGFIGSPAMNLIELVVEEHDGRVVLRGGPWTLPLSSIPVGATGAGITMGFRPEHVGLGPPAAYDEIGLIGTCELVEYLGSELLVHLRVGSDEVVAIGDPDDRVEVGDTIECQITLERIHLFDTASGRALATPGRIATRV
jgi:multiple sugar transport system ATP-binding protein